MRAGEGIGARTRRGGKVGERAGDEGRGLQIEIGVGPTQHQLIVQPLEMKSDQVASEKPRHVIAGESIDRTKPAADEQPAIRLQGHARNVFVHSNYSGIKARIQTAVGIEPG